MAARLPVLPDRPLKVHPPGYSLLAQLGWLLVAALFLVGFVMMITQPLPDLRADWQIRDTAKPIPQARIEQGKCKTHLVLVDCEATLVLRPARGPEIRQANNLFFLDIHFGDYTAEVVGDLARSPHLTTNMALDKYWNRVVTLIVTVPLFGALIWFMLASVAKALRERNHILRALDGQKLRPIALTLAGRSNKVWRIASGNAWRDWKVSQRIQPIVVNPDLNLVLGVTAGDGSVAMPLDAKLSWIGLTGPEREVLRESLVVG